MGGMASGMIAERRSCVFFDGQWYDEGAVALGIGGPYSLQPFVSQGCEPVGEAWTITGVDRNVVLGISNRPAVDVLQDTITALPEAQRQRAQNNLVVGLAVNEYRDAFFRGDFVVRGILGLDPGRGAIVLGGLPRVGQTLQFHLRDAAAAEADLEAMLERAVPPPGRVPVAALLCTCDGRGQALFGVPNHDAGLASRALGRVPLVGAFCIGEIGPLGDATVLHGFTATLGLLYHEQD
jgi:small ligand-binding sensory domain FIST